ncbi:MAG: Ig-like domain-containing protein, partial [Actinobacteria bacterium]|nr:Ig-like domain-containing protein [Actinomycetota bacterium]MCA1806991.1 Ig-like domain-containing protein [Actinomycetota bacterium]
MTFELPVEPDPTQTTIAADPDILVADGTSTSDITVQAVDEDGNNITDGGETVTLSASDGSLSPVTDNGDGTYTATFTSSTTPGVVTISGTINGDTITDTAEIELTPASGTIYYSIQSGDFDNPNVWSFTGHDGDPAGFAPGSSDIIFIGGNNNTDHTITLVNNFTLNEPGELNVVDTGDGAGILSTESFVVSGTGEFTLENSATLE